MPSLDHSTPTPVELSPADVSRIIEMAWEDRTPFEAILWRARVTGRATKHSALRSPDVDRAYCPTQYKQSHGR